MEEILTNHKITPTKLRVQILSLLNLSTRPLSYDEILEQIDANKTTIYRTLDIFLQANLITKNEINHKFFYELSKEARGYFVCETCNKFEPIELPKLPGKDIKSGVIKGICESCI